MGIESIGSRTSASYGVVKANRDPIVDDETQIDASEWNRIAQGLISVETAIGTTVAPATGSLEYRVQELEENIAPDIVASDGLSIVVGEGEIELFVEAADGTIIVDGDGVRVGEILDANHGNRGGGSLHSLAVAGVSAGFISAANQSKLEGIAIGATANSSDAALLDRANHTGSQATSTITGLDAALAARALAATTITAGAGLSGGGDLSSNRTVAVGANADGSIVVNADDVQVGVLATDAQHGVRGGGSLHAVAVASGAAGFLSGTDKAKLDGIASGATANDTDANLRDRTTHTGEQAISTVTGLQTALDGKVAGPASATDNAIVRFDATTGKLVQNSAVTIDDSGNISMPASKSISASSGTLGLSAADNVGGTGNHLTLSGGGGSSAALDGAVRLNRNGANRATRLIFAGDDNNGLSFKAPAVVTGYALTWPSTNGSANQCMVTDGSTTLSWLTPVVSPGTVTDNAIVRFDATTGRLVQNSGATVEDDGRIVAPVPINAQSGTTYTFVLSDQGKTVSGSNGSATTFSVPTNASVAYPLYTTIHILQLGAGKITIAAVTPGTTTIHPPPNLTLGSAGQYAMMTLYKIGTNEWVLSGQVSA